MQPQMIQFADFTLDPANRMLARAGEPIELGARYLDVLTLLVQERGTLITKDRFMEQVWGGVPVTDEALTQAIRSLRKALGDDAAAPRFIETVPKHGYRFIAPVATKAGSVAPMPAFGQSRLMQAAAWCAGAGAIVGFVYAATGASAGGAALSGVLVLGIVCAICAAIAGTGIAFGIVLAARAGLTDVIGTIGGAALAGLIVGTIGELLGRDGFALLTGAAPADITGAAEGAVVGLAAGIAIVGARRLPSPASLSFAAVVGAVVGTIIVLAGGRLMAGSLVALSAAFPRAPFAAALFDTIPMAALGAFEGAVFLLALAAAFRLPRA